MWSYDSSTAIVGECGILPRDRIVPTMFSRAKDPLLTYFSLNPQKQVNRLAISPDKKILAAAGFNAVR